ncbi:MAG TPA: CBS domain-containing protein [Actinomycetes bacterium]
MSAVPSRIFIARLAGLPVFATTGDPLGRVRDAVVTLRVGGRPPRVVGLVVEVTRRRRIFLPMTRVTQIDGSQVISTGHVDLRRFQARPTETLVVGELLDTTVTLLDSGERATVVDVAMEQTRTRDWLVSRVAVAKAGRRGLRRRGETSIVDWNQVSGLSLTEEGQGAANLLATFEQLRPADLANVLHELSPKRRAEAAAALDDARLADVLQELPESDQVEILAKLPDSRAADVLEVMDPDDAADLLGDLPLDEAERLLALMAPEEAAPVRRLLPYAENTAGGMMTSEPIILAPDATVADALAQVRNPELTPALASAVYVCRGPFATPTGKYLGLAHFQRLLREPPPTLVGGVLDVDLEPLRPDDALPVVTSYLATYNLVAAPVVDADDRLLGVVTVDDVLDHLLPADWRETPTLPVGGPHG